MRVLTWNLYHGRSVPPAGHALLDAFAAALDAMAWDVALLQEVPPWWPAELAIRTGAEQRTALTSRNALLPVRRFLAERWPDRIKSHGGGANAILARGLGITEHHERRLRRWPERRVVHGVRLGTGTFVVNVHSQAHSKLRAEADLLTAARAAHEWSHGAPLVLGGDFNLRTLALPGFELAGGHDVDHIFLRDLSVVQPATALEHGRLSDHAPVAVDVA